MFDDYARIFHPAWSHARQPVRWDTVAAWSGRQMHPLAQWDDLSDPIAPLAQQQSFLEPPDSDGLPAAGLAALCGVLATHTATPDTCFVGLWEGYGWPNEQWAGREVLDLENRSFLVRRGPISIAQEVGWQVGDRSFHSQPPTITWPRDRAWIFVSDPDLDSTYLGGSRALVEVLLARPELEAWRVTQSDSISAGSDTINRRRPT